jgi:hypothetical protein
MIRITSARGSYTSTPRGPRTNRQSIPRCVKRRASIRRRLGQARLLLGPLLPGLLRLTAVPRDVGFYFVKRNT